MTTLVEINSERLGALLATRESVDDVEIAVDDAPHYAKYDDLFAGNLGRVPTAVDSDTVCVVIDYPACAVSLEFAGVGVSMSVVSADSAR